MLLLRCCLRVSTGLSKFKCAAVFSSIELLVPLQMIFELINVIGQLGERGINIQAVYTLATTPEAHTLCQMK